MQSHVNVGTGTDQSIAEVAGLIGRIVGFEDSIRYNLSYPDGTPQKLLDVSGQRQLLCVSGCQLDSFQLLGVRRLPR